MHITKPETVGFCSARLKRIDALMQSYVDEGKIAGMITRVARLGKTVHCAKFGMMDREAEKPMAFDSIFHIASMTKIITSVAMMMLYEEGHFHLNTAVSEFIPGFRDVKVFARKTDDGIEVEDLVRPMTLRHLFTHTAGLSYGGKEDDPVDAIYRESAQKWVEENPGVEPTLAQMIDKLTEYPLAFQPGTHWRYSLSIDVLGRIVEIVSGTSLANFLQTRIFDPLRMVDTAYYVPPEKNNRLAEVYALPEGADDLQKLGISVHSEPPVHTPGGSGLLSTITDYGRFAQMLVNGGELNGVRLLSPKTMALYSINHTPEAALPYGFAEGEDLCHWGYGYSLGTRVLMDVSKSGFYGSVGEFGWDGAFGTYVWIDPVEKLYGLMMLQHHPNSRYPIAQRFKQLTYQAMLD